MQAGCEDWAAEFSQMRPRVQKSLLDREPVLALFSVSLNTVAGFTVTSFCEAHSFTSVGPRALGSRWRLHQLANVLYLYSLFPSLLPTHAHGLLDAVVTRWLFLFGLRVVKRVRVES